MSLNFKTVFCRRKWKGNNKIKLTSNGLRCLSLSKSWTTSKSAQQDSLEQISPFNFNFITPIQLSRKETLTIHSVWLRHHCQCPKCFNYKTYQRIKIPSDLRSTSIVTNTKVDNGQLLVSWNDGHISNFSLDWLRKHAPAQNSHFHEDNITPFKRVCLEYIFKDVSCESPKNPIDKAIPFHDFMKEGENYGVSKLLANIIKYGYGIVNECPLDFETTKRVILKVSHTQNTIYGDFSQWTNDLAHADTAYTQDVVHLHTDTSYFTEPIGLQIFHCLKHDGTGGINWLTDGFQIARKMAMEYPENYKLLASVNVPSQYIEVGKHHFISNDVTFGHDKATGTINRIRYNPHDMAILSQIQFDKVPKFYESLVLLSDLIEENPQTIKLTPGIVIFLDNWRMLHGRTAFTGFRHLCGAYISRSDWLSRARVLGVLP